MQLSFCIGTNGKSKTGTRVGFGNKTTKSDIECRLKKTTEIILPDGRTRKHRAYCVSSVRVSIYCADV